MATRVQQLWFEAFPELRIHPVGTRVRATLGDTVVVDSRSAAVVWEPRRVVPSYAVPVEDVLGELVPAAETVAEENPVLVGRDAPPVLDPRTPFAVHSCPGRPLTVRTAAGELPGAAFAPDDPDLAGQVVLDWAAFTGWFGEEQPLLAHPRDPFKRVDCLPGSRHVVLSLDGVTLADSRRPVLLEETHLPTRYYLPREDVRTELLETSTHTSDCAYKGHARYWSVRVGERLVPALAWTYEEPLDDARPVRDLVCFFTERLDLTLDGTVIERPVTPWS